MRDPLPAVLLLLTLACPLRAEPPRAAATFSVPDRELPARLVLVAYGDMRFTDTAETAASNPAARQALVAKIAAEKPAAIFINGDITWHGIDSDYAVYRDETRSWRERHLRVYPALGNHEFSACLPEVCLERWWSAFPELRGRRWYSVAIGTQGRRHAARQRRVAVAGQRTTNLVREPSRGARPRGSAGVDRHAPPARGGRANEQAAGPQPAPERTRTGRVSARRSHRSRRRASS